MMDEMSSDRYLGKWTLILGDVNTGKTSLSKAILAEMCRLGLASRIAVIDLAPEIPEPLSLSIGRNIQGVGGKLLPPPNEELLYLTAKLAAPRLSSKTEQEALAKARQNVRKIERLFQEAERAGRDILFINDVSMFLQAGSAQRLIELVEEAGTVIANGYYGKALGSGELSLRERSEMDLFKKAFHQIIWKPAFRLEDRGQEEGRHQ